MAVTEVANFELPTPYGCFEARAFECSSGFVLISLAMGEIESEAPVLTRVHSECLTGDALGSLRCDCGVQLRSAMRAIASEGRGVLIYATGHEGRGIGLLNKLRSYVAQDAGADTVDANLDLGLPIDARRYDDAAAVLTALGIVTVRLLTNNPAKADALRRCGVATAEVVPLHIAAHSRNAGYLETKRKRLGHMKPSRPIVASPEVADVGDLLGEVRTPGPFPYVVVKYAQSVDGCIATGAGDSQWISGESERTLAHALRARCDAIMVGVRTVLRDDPRLTVRLVPGASPIRVVLDTTLRTPLWARIFDDEAATMIFTTARGDAHKAEELRRRNIAVRVVPEGPAGVDMAEALRALRHAGVRTLLVEGGARVITELLRRGFVNRLVIGCAPVILGRGLPAVGNLDVGEVDEGIALTNRSIYVVEDDVVLAWDVASAHRPS